MSTKIVDIVDYQKDSSLLLPKIRQYIERHSNEKGCVVMDIDETVLSVRDADEHICIQKAGQYIYKVCVNQNVPVVFVTARQGCPSSVEYCRKQLQMLGYNEYAKLYMQDKNSQDTAAYKHKIRTQLEKEYGAVLLNVGDQMTDLFDMSTMHEDDVQSLTQTVNPHTYYVLTVAADPARLSMKFAEGPEEDS